MSVQHQTLIEDIWS